MPRSSLKKSARLVSSLSLLAGGLAACSSGQDSDTDETQDPAVPPTIEERETMPADVAAYKAENLAFLEENAAREGVTATDSGLQYKSLAEGDGATPELQDFVVVHYEGRLIDGTVFDSSRKRGEPATFPRQGLISGWVEALGLMRAGDRWELTVPADMAYGANERPSIPAHSTLIFDIELIEVKSRAALIEDMKAPQRAYLDSNAGADGVTVTDSGLQYKVLEKGTGGDNPTAESNVTVHYAGRLIDGTEFDSSYKRGEPATFPLNGVIPGWTEGLQLMQVGDKFELTVPADLGYGARGAGQTIPPYATLIFEVELLNIEG